MTCQEFLERHAEYVDDVMDPLEAAIWRDHAAHCPSCSRYDRVVRRGLRLVRELPEISPSPDFHPRLQFRIYRMEEELRAGSRASGAGAVLSLAIAGMLALLAWSPLLRLDPSLTTTRRGAGVAELAAGDGAEAGRAAPSDARARGGAEAEVSSGPTMSGGAVVPVQLAAEAEAPSMPSPGVVEVPAVGVRPFAVPIDGAEVWWWTAVRPAALNAAPSAFTPRGASLRTPGPYSPLVVGAPTFRSATFVRHAGGPVARD